MDRNKLKEAARLRRFSASRRSSFPERERKESDPRRIEEGALPENVAAETSTPSIWVRTALLLCSVPGACLPFLEPLRSTATSPTGRAEETRAAICCLRRSTRVSNSNAEEAREVFIECTYAVVTH
ncbi:hypothetical protein HPB50_009553 [Hyalomma asiaticum]|uniref:Uncharacterized protein n=1 Tax=Hyalomma asiaticum TaxID=266040 RepID=A0ACB7TF00_HYAAI|nr:hypothetical protein HPB50_009553 [Hyalomma asiaticum]